MLEHVQKTLDELREYRAAIVIYLGNIDNALGVLCKMNVVAAEAERMLKDAKPLPEPEAPNTPPAQKQPAKKKLPKGIKLITYKNKPHKDRASLWNKKVGKAIAIGTFDTVEQAVAARDKAIAKRGGEQSAKEPTGTTKGGTFFRCRGCHKEYDVKPTLCQTCAHREFAGPIERTAV